MRTPPKKGKALAKHLTRMASHSDKDSEAILQVVQIIQDVTNDNPMLRDKQLKQLILREIGESFPDTPGYKLKQYYTSGMNTMIHFLESGFNIVRASSILDNLAEEAHKNLYKPVFDKDGNQIASVFDPATANVVRGALQDRMKNVFTAQSNIISAQSRIEQKEQQDAFNVQKAEEEELNKFILSEGYDQTELLGQLYDKFEKSEVQEADFYEE